MLEKKRIIIAEDNTLNQHILQDFLKMYGYDIVNTYDNGQDLLQVFDTLNADLLLLDIGLEGSIDGVQVAEIIREKSNIPIVYITGQYDLETLARAKKTNPSGYLLKPYRKEGLITVVEIALEKAQAHQTIVAQKQFYDNILSAIQDAIFTTDLDFRVTYQNPKAEALYGKNLIGKIFFEAFDLRFITTHETIPVSRVKTSSHFEAYYMYNDDYTYFDVVVTHITEENYLITLQDITEKILRQISINDHSIELKKQNNELSFFLKMTNLIEKPGITISAMMDGIIKSLVDIIPYSYAAYGEILIGKKTFASHRMKKDLLFHKTLVIKAFGQPKGKLTFGYYKDVLDIDLDLVLERETFMIQTVITNLQRALERRIFHSNLSKTLAYERSIYEMSSRMMLSRTEASIIDDILRDLGLLFNLKNIHLVIFKPMSLDLKFSSIWNKEENIFADKLLASFAQCEWALSLLKQNQFVKIFSKQDLPETATFEQSFIEKFGFTSVLAFPIFIKKQFRGIISFIGLQEGRKWKNNYLTLLHIFTDNLANQFQAKEFQDTIQNQLEFQKTITDSVPNPIYFKNNKGEYTGWNKGFEEFCGLPSEKIMNRNAYDIFGTDYNFEQEQLEKELLKKQGIITYEKVFYKQSSKPRNVIISKASYTNSSGKVIGIVGNVVDITQQKNAEKEIKKANNRNELLIASLSSIFIDLNSQSEIVHWNPQAEINFGITQAEAVGKKLSELNIEWNWKTIQAAIHNTKKTLEAFEIKEIKYRQKTGTDGFLNLTFTPFKEDDLEGVGMLIIGSNITHQKLLENQLLQSQKLEAVGQLAAGIAHEINTPAQFVDTNIRFLEEAFQDLTSLIHKSTKIIPNEKEDEFNILKEECDLSFLEDEIPVSIEQTLEGVQRISTIVLAMKDFSHPSSGKMKKADLNRAIRSTTTIARNEWKYIAELKLELDPNLPQVECFLDDINQVILNIIINASHAIADKYNNKKVGIITIRTKPIENYIQIEIEDNGTGIPKKIRDQIFDPFFTTKEVGKGTGQGLAISYDSIVNKHNGNITVESEDGKGAKFIIQIPQK